MAVKHNAIDSVRRVGGLQAMVVDVGMTAQ
jgi:hypothetical protein